MQFPQIQMDSTFAKLGLETIKGEQVMSQPLADMSIEQPQGELTIEKKWPELSIDQTQAWEDMELYGALRSSEKSAAEGLQGASEGTERRAIEGTEMMRIENGGNPTIEQAINRSVRPIKQLGIQFIPSGGSVKVSFNPGDLQLNYERHEPVIEFQRNIPVYEYTPGKVNMQIEQYAELDIDFVHLFEEHI